MSIPFEPTIPVPPMPLGDPLIDLDHLPAYQQLAHPDQTMETSQWIIDKPHRMLRSIRHPRGNLSFTLGGRVHHD
ncbi:hypothetical protein [Rhizobium grahamii]|uniref:Uncharacterized protein n=1 Tax=Rhizobium grahamii TaxID=1120045 RepID=A0A370KEX3_9HYPH|nr:hypothetical protein [Rhizobium grahamii]RDJ02694.1 hypothetical protein B5K06_31920 [Rhizobium grahamii]